MSADLQLWGHIDLPGKLLDDEAELRATLRSVYGNEAANEYDRVTLTPPDHLVVDRHLLDIGDRGVELTHLGLGHTGNDLVVSVPDAGVVFAGDLIEESGPPAYGDDSYPLHWPATADALVRVGASMFVPGHGDVMSAPAVAEQARAISLVAALIRELHAAGIAVGDAPGEADDRWPFPADALSAAVRRGYESLV